MTCVLRWHISILRLAFFIFSFIFSFTFYFPVCAHVYRFHFLYLLKSVSDVDCTLTVPCRSAVIHRALFSHFTVYGQTWLKLMDLGNNLPKFDVLPQENYFNARTCSNYNQDWMWLYEIHGCSDVIKPGSRFNKLQGFSCSLIVTAWWNINTYTKYNNPSKTWNVLLYYCFGTKRVM